MTDINHEMSETADENYLIIMNFVTPNTKETKSVNKPYTMYFEISFKSLIG